MDWLKVRMVPLGALAVLACSGDPTGNQGTPTEITATPEVVFVTQGDSEAVVVSVVDEDGQLLEADFTRSDVGAGISVEEDPNFLSLNNSQQIRRQARFFVKGSDLTHTSFKVSALGLTKTIEVTSIPGELDAEITDSLPELGDTVTITAPTGTFFNDTSVLTFDGVAPVVVSQDETTITFIPLPNLAGPGVVSSVGVESNPALVFNLSTPFTVKTDSIIDIGSAISNPTPALGEAITLTLPAGLKLLPESLVTLSVAGNPVLPRNRTLSADSTVITFTPAPNSDSSVVVNGIVPTRLAACCAASTGYSLLLSTTAKVTTAAVTEFPSTVSNAAPAANTEITVTSTDADFTVSDTAQALVGGVPGLVTGRTANSISFVPTPSSTGPVTVNGAVIAGFSLSLPSSGGDVTTGALTPLFGTNRESTAPTLDVPGAGAATAVFDAPDFPAGFGDPVADAAGGGGSAFYKIVIPTAGDYTITTNWDIGTDLDQYLCGSPIDAAAFSNCDFTAAVANHPESATYSLTAGTYIIVINDFGEDAAGATISITIAH
jgi:hypothetical protein